MRRFALPSLAVLALACGNEPSSPSLTGTGDLTLLATVDGAGERPAAMTIRVGADQPLVLVPGTPLSLTGRTAGETTVQLGGVPAHCTADWYAPRPVTVRENAVTDVTFAVHCPVRSRGEIIFSADDGPTGDGRQLWAMASDGTGLRELTIPPRTTIIMPSRAGTRLWSYAFGPLPNESATRTADFDGTHAAPFIANRQINGLSWSPDGQRVVFGAENRLRLAYADGRGEVNLRVAEVGATSWSPDGARVVVVDHAALRILRVSDGDWSTIPTLSGTIRGVAWSPDGTRIAYTRTDNAGRVTLETIQPDGSDPRVLSPITPQQQDVLAWSPDGTRLALLLDSQVHTIRADGTDSRRITDRPSDRRVLAIHGWTP